MAFQNNNYQNNRGNNRGGYNQKPPRREEPKPAGPFPKDYVDFAEKLMSRYREEWEKNRRRGLAFISTSKLRNILSLLMDVYNIEALRIDTEITEESIVKLQMARVRLAYESGRDDGVKQFVEDANLLPWLKGVGTSREKLLHYVHYLEALVAYHRFFGGKD